MFFSTLVIIICIVGLVSLLGGVRVFWGRGWILGWCRGTLGLVLWLGAGVVAFTAWDLYSYRLLQRDTPIATISFEKLEDQHYRATLVPVDADESAAKVVELKGDQWQLDARIIRWHGWLRRLGGKPGYRLDRISGRYITLQDERIKPRTVHGLYEERSWDVWAWAHQKQDTLSWVEATYGSATFVPMADQALFEVLLSDSGLIAKPLNSVAEQAVNRWR